MKKRTEAIDKIKRFRKNLEDYLIEKMLSGRHIVWEDEKVLYIIDKIIEILEVEK